MCGFRVTVADEIEIRVLVASEVREHLDALAGQGILLPDLRRRVAAARVGDALIAAEFVRAIDQAVNPRELRGFLVIPQIRNVRKIFHTAILNSVDSVIK